MRKKHGDHVGDASHCTPKREKRGISTMSKKVENVLRTMIVPLASHAATLPSHTVFRLTEYDCLCSIMADSIRNDCPTLSLDRDSMMQAMDRAYTQVFKT